MEKPILIASTTLDEHAYEPVRTILENKGFPVVVYRTDKVIGGEENLCVDINKSGDLTITYNNHFITPDSIGSAWYRKLSSFSLSSTDTDRTKQLYIHNEISYLHDTLWALYPEKLWVNAPENIRKADKKLGQLVVARELGFSIPETVVSSHWDDISSRLFSGDNGQIVVKMVRGVISEKDKMKALYTTPLDRAAVDELTETTTPFPGIYQPFIEKAREWRVTAFGERVFAAAIYTDDTAKDDWRKLQTTSAVRFTQEELPDGIEERCIKYIGKFGLKFGAFDFIEKPDGEVVFLECNPNGQYGWLESNLGFPISHAIADELIKISRS